MLPSLGVRAVTPGPGACLTGCCLWGQREGSGAQQGMCGVEAGILCCLGTCGGPPPPSLPGSPFRSDCLAQGGALGSELSQTLGSDQGRGHHGSPTTWSDKAGSSSPSKPPSPSQRMSSALSREENRGDLHIFGRRPCSFPQQGLGGGLARMGVGDKGVGHSGLGFEMSVSHT